MSKPHPRDLIDDARGSSLAEFALVVPVFFALVFAVIHLSFVLWGETSLHWATETAARCASVNVPLGSAATGPCVTSGSVTTTSVQSYALTEYKGPGVSPVFTYTTPTCGKQVAATATYHVNVVFASIPVSMSAKSCYP